MTPDNKLRAIVWSAVIIGTVSFWGGLIWAALT